MSVHPMTGDPTRADIRAAAGVNDTIAGHWPRPYRADLRQFRRREIHGSRCDSFGDRLEGLALCERAGRADGDPGGGWRPVDHRRLADRLVAVLLAIFCAVAAYFFHDFWHQ